MKTKFLPKLLLLFVLAVFLYSCTADEISPNNTQNISVGAVQAGDPLIPKSR